MAYIAIHQRPRRHEHDSRFDVRKPDDRSPAITAARLADRLLVLARSIITAGPGSAMPFTGAYSAVALRMAAVSVARMPMAARVSEWLEFHAWRYTAWVRSMIFEMPLPSFYFYASRMLHFAAALLSWRALFPRDLLKRISASSRCVTSPHTIATEDAEISLI